MLQNDKTSLFIILVITNVKFISTSSIQDKLLFYNQYVNMSLLIERQDMTQINSWSEEFQVELVDVTAKYRLEMTRHQQHSFKRRLLNEKWMNCLKFYQNETTKSEQSYYVRENGCLKTASSADTEKRQAVTQIGREIRKWRRTFKYLKNLCQKDNLGDNEKIGTCLVDYMERDNYSYVFQRLINLRLQLLRELHQKMTMSIVTLEDCLKRQFSKYLEQVRSTTQVLNRCYGGNS